MAGRLIGAKLALFVGDKLAVLLRDDKPGLLWPGYWDLPGGGREGAETPLACALRETQEELSLRLNPSWIIWGRDYASSSGDIFWFFAAHVSAEMSDQIVLGDEGQMWDLMTPQTFLAHKRVVPQFKPRLQDYLAGVKTVAFERP